MDRHRIERHAAVVLRDLPEIYAFIARDNVAAAERVLDAMEETFETLSEQPEAGVGYRTVNPKLRGMRMLPVVGFENYLVFYRLAQGVVRILYVVHGARHLPNFSRRERRG